MSLIEESLCTCNRPPTVRGAPRPASRALIIAKGGYVHLLDHIGPDVDWEIEGVGHGEFLKGWEGDGIFVLKCRMRGWTDYFGEHDSELEILESRGPTAEEWKAWCADGEQPWDETHESYLEDPAPPCVVHPAMES